MPTYSEMEAMLYGLSDSELADLYEMYKAYGPPPKPEAPAELAQEGDYELPTYSEFEAMLYELSESELADLYEMYKAYGPPPPPKDEEAAQEYDLPSYSAVKSHVEKYGVPSDLEAAQEYELPTYSEMEALLYGLSDSELADLYEMYKAYGPPPPKPEAELAQEYELPSYSEAKEHVEKYGVPSDLEAAQEGDYELPTYSEMEALLYGLSESELEDLYAMYKAYGPPPKPEAELAQEGEDGTAPPPKPEGPPAYYGYYLPYDLTESEMDAMYEMYKAYGAPTEEDLEAMYAFYKEYGMEGLYEAATEE